MNLLPFAMAIRAPITPPKALQIAMGMASFQMMLPLKVKSISEARLVAMFTILA